jgi:hypothetical protein
MPASVRSGSRRKIFFIVTVSDPELEFYALTTVARPSGCRIETRLDALSTNVK